MSVPGAVRAAVVGRDGPACLRCGAGRGAAFHHRRSRSVVDAHTHCPCNGVWLCTFCHVQVHASPHESRLHGWIVSRHVTAPGTVPLQVPGLGWRVLACDGTERAAWDEEIPPLVP